RPSAEASSRHCPWRWKRGGNPDRRGSRGRGDTALRDDHTPGVAASPQYGVEMSQFRAEKFSVAEVPVPQNTFRQIFDKPALQSRLTARLLEDAAALRQLRNFFGVPVAQRSGRL